MGPAAEIAQGTVAVLLTLAPPCHTRICQLASKQLAAAGAAGKREEQPKMPQPLLCTADAACVHLSGKEQAA